MSIFDNINMTDPCAVYPVLESALNRLLAGEQTAELESRTDVATVRKVFNRTDISALQNRIDALRAACRIKQGKSSGRHAIRAGFF